MKFNYFLTLRNYFLLPVIFLLNCKNKNLVHEKSIHSSYNNILCCQL